MTENELILQLKNKRVGRFLWKNPEGNSPPSPGIWQEGSDGRGSLSEKIGF